MSLSGPFQADSVEAGRQLPAASAYPSRQAVPKDSHPLGRQLLVIGVCHRRVLEPTLPNHLRAHLAGFVTAAARDKQLGYADMIQARVALGELCAFHLYALGGDDVNGRFCIFCEADLAETRYRGGDHVVIPFPAGEVIDPRDLFGDEAPLCVVCGKPFDHGCNTAVCSDACASAADDTTCRQCGRECDAEFCSPICYRADSEGL